MLCMRVMCVNVNCVRACLFMLLCCICQQNIHIMVGFFLSLAAKENEHVPSSSANRPLSKSTATDKALSSLSLLSAKSTGMFCCVYFIVYMCSFVCTMCARAKQSTSLLYAEVFSPVCHAYVFRIGAQAAAAPVRKCADGRPPLHGFVLAEKPPPPPKW